MPLQRPATSEQSVGTPWAFIRAVEAIYGPMTVDLAASAHNAKAALYIDETVDSLAQDWTGILRVQASLGNVSKGNGWLNPEYGKIKPFSRKACETKGPTPASCDARVFMLVPASVGASWYWDYVHGHALVRILSPRLAFIGSHKPVSKDDPTPVCGSPIGRAGPTCEGCQPYPKDLLLACYGVGRVGFERWEWKK